MCVHRAGEGLLGSSSGWWPRFLSGPVWTGSSCDPSRARHKHRFAQNSLSEGPSDTFKVSPHVWVCAPIGTCVCGHMSLSTCLHICLLGWFASVSVFPHVNVLYPGLCPCPLACHLCVYTLVSVHISVLWVSNSVLCVYICVSVQVGDGGPLALCHDPIATIYGLEDGNRNPCGCGPGPGPSESTLRAECLVSPGNWPPLILPGFRSGACLAP